MFLTSVFNKQIVGYGYYYTRPLTGKLGYPLVYANGKVRNHLARGRERNLWAEKCGTKSGLI